MNVNNLLRLVAKDSGISKKDVRTVLDSLGKVTKEALENGETRINIVGIMKIEAIHKDERTLKTGLMKKEKTIPSHKRVSISPLSKLGKKIKY